MVLFMYSIDTSKFWVSINDRNWEVYMFWLTVERLTQLCIDKFCRQSTYNWWIPAKRSSYAHCASSLWCHLVPWHVFSSPGPLLLACLTLNPAWISGCIGYISSWSLCLWPDRCRGAFAYRFLQYVLPPSLSVIKYDIALRVFPPGNHVINIFSFDQDCYRYVLWQFSLFLSIEVNSLSENSFTLMRIAPCIYQTKHSKPNIRPLWYTRMTFLLQ